MEQVLPRLRIHTIIKYRLDLSSGLIKHRIDTDGAQSFKYLASSLGSWRTAMELYSGAPKARSRLAKKQGLGGCEALDDEDDKNVGTPTY